MRVRCADRLITRVVGATAGALLLRGRHAARCLCLGLCVCVRTKNTSLSLSQVVVSCGALMP